VVVHEVERGPRLRRCVDRPERAGDVIGLEQRSLDALRVRGLEQRPHRGARSRPRSAEQLDVVAAGDEGVAQEREDELDAAVPGGRDGDPGRRQHRDPPRALGLRHRAGRRARLLHHVV
jgi:hypothetical protein